MGFFERIGNIIKSKANRQIEKEEGKDRVGLFKVKLEEAKVAQQEWTNAVAQQQANIEVQKNEVKKLKENIKRWEESAQTAAAEGDDNTAEQAVERVVELEGQLEIAEGGLKSTKRAWENAREKLMEEKRAVAQADRQLNVLEAQEKSAELNMKSAEILRKSVGSTDIMGGIDKLRTDIETKTHTADAIHEIEDEASGKALEKKVAAMDKKKAVQERLEKLKSKSKA